MSQASASDALSLLLTRNSAAKLRSPAPDAAALELMLAAAGRAPDHARLRPWRFLIVEGENSQRALGEVFAAALLEKDPDAPEGMLRRARDVPFRAPMIIVVVARLEEHPKVPETEQLLAVGCAAHGLLLAAHGLGYAGIWRTGPPAYDPGVIAGLGLEENERIVGFLYMGTRDGREKPLPEDEPGACSQRWPA